MPLTDDKTVEIFSLLDRLGELEPGEMLSHFTSENIEMLRLASVMLKDGIDFEKILSQKRFVKVVQELYEAKKIWSSKLDETLAKVTEEIGFGNRVQALWILNGFIRFCPSPYYREIAEEVMGEYESQ